MVNHGIWTFLVTPSFILHAECSSEPLYSDLIIQTLENGLKFSLIWRRVDVMQQFMFAHCCNLTCCIWIHLFVIIQMRVLFAVTSSFWAKLWQSYLLAPHTHRINLRIFNKGATVLWNMWRGYRITTCSSCQNAHKYNIQFVAWYDYVFA